jgi:hypothetical protein
MLGIYSKGKTGWFGELLYTSPTLKVKKLETILDLSKPLHSFANVATLFPRHKSVLSMTCQNDHEK